MGAGKWLPESFRIAALAAVLSVVGVIGVAFAKDLWVHPRNESYDPSVHYRDPSDPEGEIYYKAENDIGRALGDITIGRRGKPLVTMTVGEDIIRGARDSRGSLRPVLLWDSDADGRVDRSATGRIEGVEAVFDAPELDDVNLQLTRWQLGVRYIAGRGGDTKLDGRYLASVDSSNANIAFVRDAEPELEPAKAAAVGVVEAPGLVIMKHRAEEAFDLARFAEDPTEFIEDFDRLSRDADGDDWNAAEDRMKGVLMTHFEDEDLFIVRTTGGAELEVEFGDMPMVEFFQQYLAVEADAEGCYNSLATKLVNDDGSPVTVPHRMFYCPKDSVALFDIPDGYEVGLAAFFKDEAIDKTKAGNSIGDNVKLYGKQVNPRSPLYRSTGTVTGNIGAGFRDAGGAAVDMFKHAFTGTRPENIHTGQDTYYASPVTAVPRSLWKLATLQPLAALNELFNGVDSVVQVGASAVSAIDNAVVNPIIQTTVGNALSPQAADTTGHVFGSFTQALVQNLPGGERTEDGISPIVAWQHNRAYGAVRYTRTDTQINIDRIMTIANVALLSAIENNNDSGSRGADDPPVDDMDPVDPKPGHGKPGYGKPGYGKHKWGHKRHKKIHVKKKVTVKKHVTVKKRGFQSRSFVKTKSFTKTSTFVKTSRTTSFVKSKTFVKCFSRVKVF